MADGHERDIAADSQVLHRLVFFSDAVFAIVLTLLVLELRPPEGESRAQLMEGLSHLAPHLLAFAGTFAVVSFFWAGHLANLRRLTVFDWPTVWLNLVLLFCIALTPFASAMLGEHVTEGVAWQIYCGVLIAASIAQTALWLCVSRGGGRLIGGEEGRERAYRMLRGLSPAIAFGVGYVSLLAGRGDIVVWSGLLIPVIMGLAGLLFGPRRPRPA